MDFKADSGANFSLVESHVCPSDQQGFRSKLKDGEIFETDWINATEQDCQNWALEKSFQVNFIVQNIIIIADARSSRDDTLLVQYYNEKLDPPLEFPKFGVLPQKQNTWYDFRVDYKLADTVDTDLNFGPIDFIYSAYFGCKEALTDERGVFNVADVERLVHEKDPVGKLEHLAGVADLELL